MAKGIPLMGRGPDGKAKMVNVDENGNVKVQLSGTITLADNLITVISPMDENGVTIENGKSYQTGGLQAGGYPFVRLAIGFGLINMPDLADKVEVYYQDVHQENPNFAGTITGCAYRVPVKVAFARYAIGTVETVELSRVLLSDGDIPIYNEVFRFVVKNISGQDLIIRQFIVRRVN